MMRAALAALLLTCGCTQIAGLGEFSESPCEGPCVVAETDGADVDEGDAAANEPEADAPSEIAADSSVPLDAAVEAGLEASAPDVAPDVALEVAPETLGDVGPVACATAPTVLVDLGAFSIERTEVTNAQYAAFLAKSVAVVQPAQCSWNTSFVPSGSWPAATSDCDRPVTGVDWCDAAAYCAFVGRRLCGQPIGGSVPYAGSAFTTASSDMWFAACSSNGANVYPYGSLWLAKSCVDASYDAKSGTKAVGSAAKCQAKGVLDLVGNVAEWEDSCDKSSGATDHCRVRGGAFDDDLTHATCAANANLTRSSTVPDVGIRCCAK